ncbi:MAG: outer membrane lipoprotein-sorting protein [Bacteroidales bacterium]|jgi:outer membrane lipoprotein-sorting protein|nr:outer membrane lipoprotein-sorting protein [Bacteroidales bacterium]
MKKLLFTFIVSMVGLQMLNAQNPTEIITKADNKFNGETSSHAKMKMTIKRPTWERTLEFKYWTKGKDYSLTVVTAPAKEKGQTFLMRGTEMWNWIPSISRMIKLPTSMMSEGWMGSDYTNDDIMKESSMIVDYNHKLIGDEIINNQNCYKIEMIPKEDAAVVWGKVIKWISKDEYLQMKTEYFDEDNYLIKTDLAFNIKDMNGRIIPTKFEIIPEDKNNKTIVELIEIKFNIHIKDGFFSQQNMKRIR